MTLHAVETALSLVESDTYTLEMAAHTAGTTPTHLRATLRRHGIDVEELTAEQTREHRVAAD